MSDLQRDEGRDARPRGLGLERLVWAVVLAVAVTLLLVRVLGGGGC